MIELLGKLSNYLGLPSVGSSHGLEMDYMNGWVHWLMLLLFVGWGAFFIFTIIKFREGAHTTANYDGVKSHFSRYVEIVIIVFEAVLLVGFAYPIWSELRTDVPEITADTIEVRVIAQQFAWNCHYPGTDGKFGITRPELVDEETITVSLTSVGKYQELYVKDFRNNEVMIGCKTPTRKIYCHYVIYGERKDIDKLEVEL